MAYFLIQIKLSDPAGSYAKLHELLLDSYQTTYQHAGTYGQLLPGEYYKKSAGLETDGDVRDDVVARISSLDANAAVRVTEIEGPDWNEAWADIRRATL